MEESATTEAKGIQRDYTLSLSTATRGGGWACEVDCNPRVPMNWPRFRWIDQINLYTSCELINYAVRIFIAFERHSLKL